MVSWLRILCGKEPIITPLDDTGAGVWLYDIPATTGVRSLRWMIARKTIRMSVKFGMKESIRALTWLDGYGYGSRTGRIYAYR